MKIRLFNFIKRKPSRNINYNPPLKNIKSIPSNLLKKQEPTTGELLIEITEQIKKILANIDKKDKEILAQLKKNRENKLKIILASGLGLKFKERIKFCRSVLPNRQF